MDIVTWPMVCSSLNSAYSVTLPLGIVNSQPPLAFSLSAMLSPFGPIALIVPSMYS